MREKVSPTRRSIRRNVLAGLIVFALLAGGVGGWASTTKLSGALIAAGQIVVDSNVKKVQHPTGGVIGELRVRDGDRVRAADVVARLDPTITQSNLAIITKGLDELWARKARLAAERDGANAITFPPELTKRAKQPDVAAIMDGERKLFDLRRTSRLGQKAQLKQQSGQLQEEIVGLTGQQAAKRKEVELIARELEGVREPGSAHAAHPARAGSRPARRRAGAAHRRGRSGERQDRRDRAQDHRHRPGSQ